MPWTDWQFWVVSLAALWAGYVIFRQIIPNGANASPACSTCTVASPVAAAPDAGKHPSELPVVSNRR